MMTANFSFFPLELNSVIACFAYYNKHVFRAIDIPNRSRQLQIVQYEFIFFTYQWWWHHCLSSLVMKLNLSSKDAPE